MKLIRSLRDLANNSLVLIDELELALHPKAQIELLRYLQEVAQRKRLTVIFSTHSVSLLKRVDRSNMMLLENNGGVVSTIRSCYPTYALGSIAYDEERAPDVVFYVEDEAALFVTDHLVKLVISARMNQVQAYPTVHVVPIGSFLNVIRFIARGEAMLPHTTKCSALLDQDVQQETVHAWQLHGNHTRLAEFQALGNQIGYLPWTPEVGLVGFLRDQNANAQGLIRAKFNDHRLHLASVRYAAIPAASGGPQRDACKAAVDAYVEYINELQPNGSELYVRKSLFEVFAEWFFTNNRAVVMQLLAPRLA